MNRNSIAVAVLLINGVLGGIANIFANVADRDVLHVGPGAVAVAVELANDWLGCVVETVVEVVRGVGGELADVEEAI